MTQAQKVFLEALDDLREGRGEPVEHYLDRVPATEREELAELLAGYFASRTGPFDPRANAAIFERALETVDRVMAEHDSEAGVLPSMLKELSRTRGLRRRELVARLREELGLPEVSASALGESYHRLEAGQVPGPSLSRRLLAALGAVLRVPTDELDEASRPLGPPRRLQAVAGFGRGGRPEAELTAVTSAPRPTGDAEVDALFYGGRDA